MTNNWLTKFDQNKQIATTKKVQLAAQQSSFAQKVQAMRVATGKVESRRVNFRCACTSAGFHADFERANPTERFRIARIEKEIAASAPAGFGGGFGLTRPRSNTAFDYREFDTTGWHCPWCNRCDGFVHCTDCGENVCKARTTTRAGWRRVVHLHACLRRHRHTRSHGQDSRCGSAAPRPARGGKTRAGKGPARKDRKPSRAAAEPQ